MRVTFQLDPSQLSRGIVATLGGSHRRQILGAMAAKFKWLTLQNFGDAGTSRPRQWPPLSPAYSKRVGRSHATLFLTSALFRSIQLRVTDDFAQVFTVSDYGEAHQWGNGRLPARPFMPMTQTNFTPYAEAECVKAGQQAYDAIIQGKSILAFY